MANGRIEIRKLNIMGYTPETQAYVIQNAGGVGSVATFHFLQQISKWLDYTSFGWAIGAPRLAKFRAYVEAQGFEVVDGLPV